MTRTIRVTLFLAVSLIVSAALLKPCAADPSMDMEGDGQAGAGPQCTCPATGCTGTLKATLSGFPLGKANVVLNLVTHNSVSSNGGCAPATGTGQINNSSFSVTFSGQVCDDFTNSLFSVNGAVQLVIHPERPGLGEAASGNLSAVGSIHLPCFPFGKNPFPEATAGMIVGIIGVAGQIPLLTP